MAVPTSLKRRRLVTSLVALPAASTLMAQQGSLILPGPGQPAGQSGLGGGFRGGGPVEMPALNPATPEAVGEAVVRFFSKPQFEALRKLASLFMPPMNGSPGAVEAQAPEFLDYLLGESGTERKQLYRTGLDGLNSRSAQRYKKPFADLDDAEAAVVLAPLRTPWTSKPTDPFEKFLRASKADLRTATLNSRAYASNSSASNSAGNSPGNRRQGGTGLYWHPLD